MLVRFCQRLLRFDHEACPLSKVASLIFDISGLRPPTLPSHTLLVALMLTFHPAQALLIQMSFNLQLALRYDPVNPFKAPIQF